MRRTVKLLGTMGIALALLTMGMTGCAAVSEGEADSAISSEEKTELSETGDAPSVAPALQLKEVRFENVALQVPESYQELTQDDDSAAYFVDSATGDGVSISKVVLPEKVSSESAVLSVKSAVSNMPAALGAEGVEGEPHIAPGSDLPIYGLDTFEGTDGKYYACRSAGFDQQTFYVVLAWCASDDPERLGSIADSLSYLEDPDYELSIMAYADEYGEEAAKSVLREDVEATQQEIVDRAYARATTSQKNAMEMAKRYIELAPFSQSGLIDQLMFEGFSREDAEYGATYLVANWFDQARLKAKDYMDLKPFSRSGLIEQLEFEGFTHEQAVAGADSVGL